MRSNSLLVLACHTLISPQLLVANNSEEPLYEQYHHQPGHYAGHYNSLREYNICNDATVTGSH